MKPKSTLLHCLLAACALVSLPNVSATEYWWNQNGTTAGWGGNNTWNTTNAFFSTTAPDTASAGAVTTTTADTLNFGTSTTGFAGGGNILAAGQSIGTIVTGSANTNYVSINNGILTFAASGTITNNSPSPIYINSIIAGAATRLDLNANGGEIAMTGAGFTYTGITYINSGTVISNNADTLGASGTDANRTVVASGARLVFNNSRTYTERFEIAGAGVGGTSGALVNTANRTTTLNGQVTLSDNATTYSDSSSNALTFGGGIVLGANELTFNSVNAGSIQTVQTTAISGANGSVKKTGSGVLNLNVASSYTGGTTLDAGTINIGAAISGSNSAIGSTSGTLTVNGGTLNMAGNNVTVGNLTGSGGVISGTSGTRTLTIGEGNNGGGNYQGAINNGSGGTTALTKTGTGTIALSGANGYSGATTVSQGTLTIGTGGSINSSSGITIASGAHFKYNSSTALTVGITNSGGKVSGSGNLGAVVLGGTGSVDPGNSPGIMTAGSTDPAGGLDYNFEFTAANVNPTWNNATDSGNDVLRLTSGTAPFAGNLDTDNVVSIYLDVASVTVGDTFTGGLFTDRNSDFLLAVQGATFQFFIQNAGGLTNYNGETYTAYAGLFDVETIQIGSADFSGGTITNGWSTQFTVVTIPEPGAAFIGSLGLLALLRRRR